MSLKTYSTLDDKMSVSQEPIEICFELALLKSSWFQQIHFPENNLIDLFHAYFSTAIFLLRLPISRASDGSSKNGPSLPTKPSNLEEEPTTIVPIDNRFPASRNICGYNGSSHGHCLKNRSRSSSDKRKHVNTGFCNRSSNAFE